VLKLEVCMYCIESKIVVYAARHRVLMCTTEYWVVLVEHVLL
jgi:hypothetical protein